MDAQTQFRLARFDALLLRRARNRAGIERHADRDDAFDHFFGRTGDGLQIGTLIGHRACDLVDEQCACHTTRLRKVRQSNVIIHHHHRDL